MLAGKKKLQYGNLETVTLSIVFLQESTENTYFDCKMAHKMHYLYYVCVVCLC